MREIKFRGITIEPLASGENWIYTDDEMPEIYLNHADKLAYINMQAVRYDSVTQYTGLKDKNGVEIYEFDILDGSYNMPTTGQLIKKRYVVAMEKGCYIAKAKKHPYGSTALSMIHTGVTVIGNIFENPELLEDADN